MKKMTLLLVVLTMACGCYAHYAKVPQAVAWGDIQGWYEEAWMAHAVTVDDTVVPLTQVNRGGRRMHETPAVNENQRPEIYVQHKIALKWYENGLVVLDQLNRGESVSAEILEEHIGEMKTMRFTHEMSLLHTPNFEHHLWTEGWWNKMWIARYSAAIEKFEEYFMITYPAEFQEYHARIRQPKDKFVQSDTVQNGPRWARALRQYL